MQHFSDSDAVIDAYVRQSLPNNSDVHSPGYGAVDAWPPALIFDFTYGCAAIKAWSPKSFKTFIARLNHDDYYELAAESGESNSESVDTEAGVSQPMAEREARYHARETKREENQQKRKRGGKKKSEENTLSEVMDMVMGLWMHVGQPEQDVPVVDHCAQEKVEAWLAHQKVL